MKYAWQLQKPKEIGSRTHRHPQPQPTQRLDWQCVRLSIPLYVSLYLYLCLPEINMTAMPTRESKLGCDVFKQNSMRSYLIEGRNKCSSFLSTVSSLSLSSPVCEHQIIIVGLLNDAMQRKNYSTKGTLLCASCASEFYSIVVGFYSRQFCNMQMRHGYDVRDTNIASSRRPPMECSVLC